MRKVIVLLLLLGVTVGWSIQGEEKATLQAYYSLGSISNESTLEIEVTIEENWHITSNNPKDEYLIPAEMEPVAQHVTFGSAHFPIAHEIYIKELDITTSQFEGTFTVTIPLKNVGDAFSQKDSLATVVNFTYQPCDDKMCLPPVTSTVVVGGEVYRPKKNGASEGRSVGIASVDAADEKKDSGIWLKILFAIIGGLILNLMPCVLPVLSLKIFSLVKQAGESRARLLKLGVAFSAGIFVSFWALATMVVVLRSAGSLVGWGFQFQNPLFIVVMAAIMIVFALNMFGLFEIFLPSSTNTKLNLMSSKGGYAGAFFNGILMTLLSTPCSAPFLGSAMGYAFSQTTVVLFIMFSAVAFGLALPYMLLTLFPIALKWVPKPGNWMVRLKEFMGFLLLATVIWLLAVLSEAYGSDLATWTSVLLLVLSMNAWLYSKALPNGGMGMTVKRKLIVWLVIIGTSLLAYSWLVHPHLNDTPSKGIVLEENEASYSEEKLSAILQSGRPVFLDFTAAWCITCKSNKKLVLNTQEVQDAFAELDVVYMVADWTNGDELITKKLKSFGRAGVPLYVIYSHNNPSRPMVLPELINTSMVLDSLSKI